MWEMATEVNAVGFNLWCGPLADGAYTRLGAVYVSTDIDVTMSEMYDYKFEALEISR